jgi:deoxyribonuclease IV
MSKIRRIGAHVSAAGGLDKAVERAANIGANCLQVFSGSPRVWARADLAKVPVKKFLAQQEALDVRPVFTHSLYLVNVASDNPLLLEKSIKALAYDLKFDALIGGSGVVVHLGSHQGRGWEAVREGVAERLVGLLAKTPDNSTLLIENSAGQNGKLCSDLSEIRWLFDRVGELAVAEGVKVKQVETRLGWCFDTCHSHAAGYRLGDPATIEGEEQSAIATIEKLNLWERLRCIHVNDSRDLAGAGRDRHANLGEGMIPHEELKFFLNHPRTQDLPLILEVPGIKKDGPDAENVRRLRELVISF